MTLKKATFVLAILSTVFLVFNMSGIMLFKQQIFFERQSISTAEIILLIGFAVVLIFDIVSFFWVFLKNRTAETRGLGNWLTVLLAATCIVLLLGDKIMADEIGREYQLGWEVLGEWIILYIFLTTQLVYNVVIFFQLFRESVGRK